MAPPPVETCVKFFGEIFRVLRASIVSPPPMMVVAPFREACTIAWAIFFVPCRKGLYSETPMGPFQMTVPDFLIRVAN